MPITPKNMFAMRCGPNTGGSKQFGRSVQKKKAKKFIKHRSMSTVRAILA
jgi:hypothetical protein